MAKQYLYPDVYVMAAHRTAVGSFYGQFQDCSAPVLGATNVRLCLHELGLNGIEISHILIGQVATSGLGYNPATRTAELAGIPISPTLFSATINRGCATGLKVILEGYLAIKCGAAELVVCGGQENLTLTPQFLYEPPGGGPVPLFPLHISYAMEDLSNGFTGIEMRERANYLADQYNISRGTLDKYAFESLRKAITAMQNNNFDQEIVTIYGWSKDENVVKNMPTTLEMLKDKPTLLNDLPGKPSTITDGNSAIYGDGAAAIVLCSDAQISVLNKHPLAKVVSTVEIEIPQIDWGIGSANAIQTILNEIGWSKDEVDLYEIQEVFAVQALIVIRKLQIDPLKVNVSGGALAFGHPVAASSANMLVTLVYNLRRLGLKKGIAAACTGKDIAVAIAVEGVPPLEN